jgi:hypothetical protein
MKRALSALTVLGATAAVSFVGFGGVASAATPVVHACVGSTFSAGAHNVQPLGPLVVGFAQAPDGHPGLGDGIQALQSGDVTQDVVPNTCNTPS